MCRLLGGFLFEDGLRKYQRGENQKVEGTCEQRIAMEFNQRELETQEL